MKQEEEDHPRHREPVGLHKALLDHLPHPLKLYALYRLSSSIDTSIVGIICDEISARSHIFTHKHREDTVSLGSVVDGDLLETSLVNDANGISSDNAAPLDAISIFFPFSIVFFIITSNKLLLYIDLRKEQ